MCQNDLPHCNPSIGSGRSKFPNRGPVCGESVGKLRTLGDVWKEYPTSPEVTLGRRDHLWNDE